MSFHDEQGSNASSVPHHLRRSPIRQGRRPSPARHNIRVPQPNEISRRSRLPPETLRGAHLSHRTENPDFMDVDPNRAPASIYVATRVSKFFLTSLIRTKGLIDLLRSFLRGERRRNREVCMDFNDYNHCQNGEQCPFIHINKHVSICTHDHECRKHIHNQCPYLHWDEEDPVLPDPNIWWNEARELESRYSATSIIPSTGTTNMVSTSV